jgi:hypothetical protein
MTLEMKRCDFGSPPISERCSQLSGQHTNEHLVKQREHATNYAGGVNEKEIADPEAATNRLRVTAADLRRFADSVRDLDDPAVMAHAWQ